MRFIRFRLSALLLALTAQEVQAQIRIDLGGRRGRDSTRAARDSAAARDRAARAGAANQSRQRPRTAEEIAASLPDSSMAHPEMFGWRLGVSTIEEVKGSLTQMTPAMLVREALRVPVVAQSQGAGSVPVPGSEHVPSLRAESQVYVNQSCYQPTAERGNCERYAVRFALPPTAPVAIGVEREVMLAPHALREVVEASLNERFGQPTLRNAPQSGVVTEVLIWVWDLDGNLWPPTPRERRTMSQSACTGMQATIFEIGDGCAAVLKVEITATPEGFVTRMMFKAEDYYTRHVSWQRTKAMQDSVMAVHVRQLRESAAKVRAP